MRINKKEDAKIPRKGIDDARVFAFYSFNVADSKTFAFFMVYPE